MKYIDAEKLKELLDEKYKEFTEKAKKDCPLQYQYMADGLDIAEQFIDSLQQEQQTDKQVVVITESHGDANIEWDCRSIDDVKELLAAGARYVSKEQEQPEVDLEKEINIEISKWTCYEEIGFGARYDAKPFDGRDIEKIARHFYELGLNARKK